MSPATRGEKPKPCVAHIVHTYYLATENWIETQIRNLARYQAIVLTSKTANLESPVARPTCALACLPVLARRVNHLAYPLLGYYPAFRKMIREWRPRVIHAHFGDQGYHALSLARSAGLPLVTTFYGLDAAKLPQHYPVWRKRYHQLFAFGDCFLVEGNHMMQQLVNLGCPREKIRVHHLGVNLGDFESRPRLLSGGEPIRLLMVGRFVEKKGIVYALQALATLLKRKVSCQLTIIGDAPEQGDQAYLRETRETKGQILATIEQSGLAGHVHLPGMQTYQAIKQAYYDHHLFLAPSVQATTGDNEGGAPVTLIEAAATGMPAVATSHCDIPEVVRDGVTGLLCPERDSSAVADTIVKLTRHPNLIREMGVAARQHMKAEYDAIKQGERLADVYAAVTAANQLFSKDSDKSAAIF